MTISEKSEDFYNKLNSANQNYSILDDSEKKAGIFSLILAIMFMVVLAYSTEAGSINFFKVIPMTAICIFCLYKKFLVVKKMKPLEQAHLQNVEELKAELIELHNLKINNLPSDKSEKLEANLAEFKYKLDDGCGDEEGHLDLVNIYTYNFREVINA
jgi:hypothetical protein